MTLTDLRAQVEACRAACCALVADDRDVRSSPDAVAWLEGGLVWDATARTRSPVDGAESHLLAALDCVDAALVAVRDFQELMQEAAE